MEERLNESRERIDELMNHTDTFIQSKIRFPSGNMLEVYQSLRMAKAWLGKTKGALNLGSTYKVVDKEELIPETKETSKGLYYGEKTFPKDISNLVFLNTMRQVIEELVNEWINYLLADFNAGRYVGYAVKELETARINLGFELGDFRDETKMKS